MQAVCSIPFAPSRQPARVHVSLRAAFAAQRFPLPPLSPAAETVWTPFYRGRLCGTGQVIELVLLNSATFSGAETKYQDYASCRPGSGLTLLAGHRIWTGTPTPRSYRAGARYDEPRGPYVATTTTTHLCTRAQPVAKSGGDDRCSGAAGEQGATADAAGLFTGSGTHVGATTLRADTQGRGGVRKYGLFTLDGGRT